MAGIPPPPPPPPPPPRLAQQPTTKAVPRPPPRQKPVQGNGSTSSNGTASTTATTASSFPAPPRRQQPSYMAPSYAAASSSSSTFAVPQASSSSQAPAPLPPPPRPRPPKQDQQPAAKTLVQHPSTTTTTTAATSTTYRAPQPRRYEAYGEVGTATGDDIAPSSSTTTTGISKRLSAAASTTSSELNASVGLSGFATAANRPYLGGGGGGVVGGNQGSVYNTLYPDGITGHVSDRNSAKNTLQDKQKGGSDNSGTFYGDSPNSAATLSFLIPSVASILWFHDSATIVQCFLSASLILYALDLIDSKDGLAVGVWIVAFLLTMASGFGMLLQVDDADATGGAMLGYMAQLAVEGVLYCSWACWITLQCHWLHKDLPVYAGGLECALHSMLPPISSSILTYNALRLLMNYWGMDRIATMGPLIFSFIMAVSMLAVGSCQRAFQSDLDDVDTVKQKQRLPNMITFSISSFNAKLHSMLLLVVPGLMHLLIFRHRIFGRLASFDDLWDLVLVWTVPYLLHCAILMSAESNPYSLPSLLFPKTGYSTLRGTIVPMVATLIASVAAQQRYLIPLCSAVGYQFHGHNLSSPFVMSLYLTGATVTSLFAVWIWGRTSSETNELLFGEYHEDVVQLSISASGMLLGKAFGFPWNLTPLPILAFLGLSVWLTTRMMRYLCIFLFVIHAAGVVLFSYRYASIAAVVSLPLPVTVNVGLIRFGMIEVIGSVLIGLVVGFVARPAGGFGSEFLKRVDVPGFILVSYTGLLSLLELTLLRHKRPTDLVGTEFDTDVEDSDFLYDHGTAVLTTCLIMTLSAMSRRYNVISRGSNLSVLSLALGKAVALVIDASESDNKIRTEQNEELRSRRLVYRALAASVLFLVILAPKALLMPIHVKNTNTARYRRSLADGKPQAAQIPSSAYRKIILYCIVILPGALIASVPLVLSPLVMALSTHYNGGAYYRMALPLSEMIGFVLCIWGIASLSMLNHLLPDGGAETWKKASALTLLMGMGIAFSAPAMPEWLASDAEFGISNPYAAISSLGSQLANQGRSRTGGWGLLSACLASLLAVTGPLELRERRPPSGKKDRTLFLRLMCFSIMFGSGVAWFVTIQSMSQAHFLPLAVTSLASLVISFFGTVACVLGYYVELENFDEVDQMSKVWAGAFGLFGLVVIFPSVILSSSATQHFGPGGSLATYLTVAALATLSMSTVLRIRQTKNQLSRSLGNLACIVAYLCIVTVANGRLGVAGLNGNFDVTTVIGIPGSILATLCAAPMLMLLEGEATTEKRNRVSRMGGTTGKPVKVLGITLKNLGDSNRSVPPLVFTVLTFYLSGLYTIFIRGSVYIGSNVPKTHKEAMSFFGRNKDTVAAMAEKATSYSQALVLSARLAGSGFWTASNPFGPIIHLAGIAATVPSIFLLVTQLWTGVKRSRAQVVFALPFNIFTILFCKGTPSVQAVALIAMVGGLLQLLQLQRHERRSHMRI